jgi:hypothetical protein
MTLLVQNSYSPRATLTVSAQAAVGAANADRRHKVTFDRVDQQVFAVIPLAPPGVARLVAALNPARATKPS